MEVEDHFPCLLLLEHDYIYQGTTVLVCLGHHCELLQQQLGLFLLLLDCLLLVLQVFNIIVLTTILGHTKKSRRSC